MPCSNYGNADWVKRYEDLSNAVGRNRIQLKSRLMHARAVLRREYRKYFTSPVFDFEKKRLVGTDGYALQWRVRERPDQPESYENQQTCIGTVVLVQLEEESEESYE